MFAHVFEHALQGQPIIFHLFLVGGGDIDGQQVVGRAQLHAVPGKEKHGLGAAGDTPLEGAHGVEHAAAGEIGTQGDIKARLLQGARHGARVGAGVVEFGDGGIAVVADDQRQALAAGGAGLGVRLRQRYNSSSANQQQAECDDKAQRRCEPLCGHSHGLPRMMKRWKCLFYGLFCRLCRGYLYLRVSARSRSSTSAR